MVVREILDELTAIEKSLLSAIKLSTELAGTFYECTKYLRAKDDVYVLGRQMQFDELGRRLQSGLKRVTRTKQRIRACVQPMAVPLQHTPKPIPRRAA